ncbi:hypothetical protein [Vibrio parahaemolyticus]|uniref:hypothetical protein n=1 Tax=Vibrio parahaemolyticus TaxID=670 RepID=UPI0012ADF940|nr:hypothetical protein [Vibrio parahaemolyticus]HCE4957884.1 hypothetical protein [Vibrio parahaemolyticus]
MKIPIPLLSASTAILLVAFIEAAASGANPAWKIFTAIFFVINFVGLIEKLSKQSH